MSLWLGGTQMTVCRLAFTLDTKNLLRLVTGTLVCCLFMVGSSAYIHQNVRL